MTRDEVREILGEIRGEYVCFYGEEYPKYHALSMAIQALSEPRWIPCDEKLPEANKRVLVTEGFTNAVYCARLKDEPVGIYWRSQSGFPILKENILAWMPLPQPYERREP